MAFTKPAYSTELTRKNWDKNKSVLAKMSGFTGIGEGLAKLEATYNKIDWTIFDMQEIYPRGSKDFTLPKLEKSMQEAVKSAKSGDCAKLREEAFALRDLAQKTEKDYKANKLIPKSTTALCASIAKAADQLGVAVNGNSMGGYVLDSGNGVRSLYDKTLESIQKNFKGHVAALEKAFMPVVKEPTYEKWNGAGIMTLARNLNQQIGNVENLTSKGYDTGMDLAACNKFFKDMNLYARVAVPFEKDAEESDRKDHVKKLLKLIIQAKTMR